MEQVIRLRIFVRSALKTESSSMLLLATATGPGLVAVGVASRLFDGAPAIHDPLLVDMVGFGEAVEGPMMIDEEGCIWPMWRESETVRCRTSD